MIEMDEQNQAEFEAQMPIYVCPYCGKEAPSGLDHPNLFACCGEIGHAEEA